MTRQACLCVVLLLASAQLLPGQTQGAFELLGDYKGLGGLVASSVGPGPTEGSERFYSSYLYLENSIDVVAVDPETGESQVFTNPAAGEYGARCMVLGPDGNLYLGTLPRAHFLKLDPKAGTLTDLGRPSGTEQYIWDVAFGADGRLYGATYPQSKLVRYDPSTGKLEDLGRMDPVEQYAHYVAGSDDGFLYVGIGTSRANIAAYEIATGEHREILPEEHQIVAQAFVYRGVDGRVYGRVGSQNFRLEGWTATAVAAKNAPAAVPNNLLRDGRSVGVSGRTIRVTDPKTRAVTTRPFLYEGNSLPMFRVGHGPDGELYASAVLPIHFLRLDAGQRSMVELGDLGGGEIYSFLSRGDRLILAAYSGLSPLMVWDPSKPFYQGAGEKNPLLVNYPGSDGGWRPQALINGPLGRVYIGSVAGYGKLGGPLTVWDTDAGSIEQYHNLIEDQSVISLTVWNDVIVGGTTTGGGGGSHPTQKEAKLFLWDPQTREKVFELVPVAGAAAIDDLLAAPNGLVYGIAGRTLFVFDPGAREVVARNPMPFSGTIYNSVAVGPDGAIWGLASSGIFRIDLASNQAALVDRSPRPISAGFSMVGNSIYYVSQSTLWRYTLPWDGVGQ